MIGYIFSILSMIFSFWLFIVAVTTGDFQLALAWLIAGGWATAFLLSDLFEGRTAEQQKLEDKRVESYLKLMNAADTSK